MMEKSKVKLNYELPEDVVDDHTYEVIRLKFKVKFDMKGVRQK